MSTKRFLSLLVAVALAAVAILIAQDAFATPNVASDSPETVRMEDYIAAEAARWTAMGEYYERLEESKLQLRGAADTARWEAMGEYYLNQSRRERGQDADAARLKAMADYYQHVFGK